MNVVEWIVYGVRFLLEMVAVFGLIGGGLILGKGHEKILYPILGVLIVILWGSFVAPKAANPQGPMVKFVVEAFSFTVGTIGIYQLFGSQWGLVYGVVALIDLVLVYLLLFLH